MALNKSGHGVLREAGVRGVDQCGGGVVTGAGCAGCVAPARPMLPGSIRIIDSPRARGVSCYGSTNHCATAPLSMLMIICVVSVTSANAATSPRWMALSSCRSKKLTHKPPTPRLDRFQQLGHRRHRFEPQLVQRPGAHGVLDRQIQVAPDRCEDVLQTRRHAALGVVARPSGDVRFGAVDDVGVDLQQQRPLVLEVEVRQRMAVA